MNTKKIILDTNFLLIPGQFNIDIFSEIDRLMDEPFEIYVLEGSLEELEKLSKGSSKDSQAAKLGFDLAEQKGLKTLRGSHDHVDDAIVDIVDENTLVATQDKELKERVKENQGKLIVMRQKQHLVKEG